jgi:predicted amidohydrolase YtcJ
VKGDCVLVGYILTLDSSHPEADAVATQDGRTTDVGAAREARRNVGPRAEVISLAGRVAPELHRVARDPILPGRYLKEVDCRYCSSIEEIVEAPRARAKVTSLGEWVVGNGTITRSPVIGVVEVQGGATAKSSSGGMKRPTKTRFG